MELIHTLRLNHRYATLICLLEITASNFSKQMTQNYKRKCYSCILSPVHEKMNYFEIDSQTFLSIESS